MCLDLKLCVRVLSPAQNKTSKQQEKAMNLQGKVIIITGAANGIGAAMARRFQQEQPEKLILADIDEDGLNKMAAELDSAVALSLIHI